MQIWAESGKSALPICNYSQILYQFLTFTQNLKRSQMECDTSIGEVSVNHHSHKDNYSQRGKAGTIILDNSTGDISVSY